MANAIAVVPTVDTSAYTSGDTLFNSTLIAAAGGTRGGTLDSITVIDKADNAAADIELYFFTSAVTFGTVNAAPSISDADAIKCIGKYTVASASFKDVGASKIGGGTAVGLPVTFPLYVAATVTGTPTYAAATDLKLVFGFR